MLPSDREARKEMPIASGCIDYFPLALAEVAHVSFVGNEFHNPGEPLHWAREKSTDHADCVARHLIERGTIDTDGLRHTAKIAWRALAMLQEEIEGEHPTDMVCEIHPNSRWPHGNCPGPGMLPRQHSERPKPDAPVALACNYDGEWVYKGEGGFKQAGCSSDVLYDEIAGAYRRCAYLDGTFGAWVPLDETRKRFISDGSWVPYAEPTGRKLYGDYFHPDINDHTVQDTLMRELLDLDCRADVAANITLGTTFPAPNPESEYVPNWVYLAGPMRGYENYNFPAFDDARDNWVRRRYAIISPADIDRAAGIGDINDPGPFVYRDLFALLLAASHKGSIAMLPGWEKSTGACAEFFLARWLGLKIRDAQTRGLMRAGQAYANLLNSVDDYLDGQVEGK